jgi:hypothetical protein
VHRRHLRLGGDGAAWCRMGWCNYLIDDHASPRKAINLYGSAG